MASEKDRTKRKTVLTEEQREYLRDHQVQSEDFEQCIQLPAQCVVAWRVSACCR